MIMINHDTSFHVKVCSVFWVNDSTCLDRLRHLNWFFKLCFQSEPLRLLNSLSLCYMLNSDATGLSAFSLCLWCSELESRLCSVVRSIVPSKSYLSTKGDALYEYLSSLGQISRSEASRLSENLDKTKQKRYVFVTSKPLQRNLKNA